MIGTVVVTEFIKLRRSVVPWITLAVMLAGPWVLALFMWIIREPERAASLGLLGTKANLAGLPPVTLVNAEIDPLQSDGTLLADKLRAANVPVKHMVYPGVTHEFFGADAVLMNTAIAEAEDAARMAKAMRLAVEAGRLAYLAGRMPRRLYASASSPLTGVVR